MSEENRITNIDVRPQEKEMFFTVNHKSKYKIPSKMFPLANKKNQVFLRLKILFHMRMKNL